MRRILAVFLLILMAAASCACMGPQEVAYVTTVPTETETEPSLPATEPQPEVSFSYGELKDQKFWFSSGAGGWRTQLRIASDGSFSGDFTDSNMGESGEGYTGTEYRCRFSGRFGQPEPVNEYTLSLPIEALTCEEAGQEIVDGVLQIRGGEPYGLDGTESMLLYLPGAPLKALPEHFLRWVGCYDSEEETMPFYGLFNEPQENGFSSFDVIAALREEILAAEEQERHLEAGALTQADMNMAASAKYELWDGLLNRIWQELMERLEEEDKRLLTNEELVWIRDKEQAVTEAGKDVEGGTLYPAVTSGTAAKWTKERVFVLMGILEDLP